jgi:UDP-3-O-[3-hydroxymyristoyl] glucosamine N-acyltransferase
MLGAAVHVTAVVETDRIGADVIIDPYAVIGPEVVLEQGVHVHAAVVLMGPVHVGPHTEIYPGAVIGKPPATSLALSRRPDRRSGVRLGARTSVGVHAIIYEDVTIGDDSLIGDGASIREHCQIGRRSIIGRAVSLHPDCLIGDLTRIYDHSHIATASRIGREVFISVHVSMVSDPAAGRDPFDPARVRGPVVGDRVIIGAAATLLPGIVVGNDAVIGAGAVVTKDVAAAMEVRGVPARPLASESRDA